MDIEVVPLSRLEMDPQRLLTECCDLDRGFIIELPDHRLVAIQPLEPDGNNDHLVENLLTTNARFRELVEKSKNSPRKEFLPEPGTRR